MFDPLLAGPAALGGPVALQLWRRDDLGLCERVHFGSAPLYSQVLQAWFVPDGGLLRIKNTPQDSDRWLTAEEQERAARLDVERQLAELEARLM